MLLSQIAALMLAGAIIGSALTLTRHHIATAARHTLRTVADLAARAVSPIPLFRTHPGRHTRHAPEVS